MQLLYSRALPAPEFVSLSLQLNGDMSDEAVHQIRDPLLLPSPVSTISRVTAIEAVWELHRYLICRQKAARSNVGEDTFANALLKEDENQIAETQVFRPANGQGMGLHYKVIRDRTVISPLVQLCFRFATKSPDVNVNIKGIEKEVAGVIFCVAVTGLPSIFSVSPVHYSLSQRMDDCINIVSKTGAGDSSSCATLLASLLLADTESRLTNSMASGQEYHLFGEMDDGRGGLLNTKKKSTAINHDIEFENPLAMNSADHARLMIERMAVLSVAETETIFSKYEGKSNEKSIKARRRKAGRDADLDGFDFRAEPKGEHDILPSVSVSDASSVKSGSSRLLKQPKKDTARIIHNGLKSRQASVPALLASHKDTGGKTRRQLQVDQSGKNRPGNRLQVSEPFQSSWDGDLNTANNFDPFSFPTGDSASVISDASASRRTKVFDREMSSESSFGGEVFGLSSGTGHSRRRPQSSQATSGDESSSRLLVNVALNEDLTCFYKLSKMSSCSVEGVVQVQVKTNVDEVPPFLLVLNDPSSHILSIQENKKFASELSRGEEYKFQIRVPKDDNYFPVMRYKCGDTLRPVPIVSVSKGCEVCSSTSSSYPLHRRGSKRVFV